MISIYVLNQSHGPIVLNEYGLENISEHARWGPCARDTYILHYVIKGKGFFNGQPVSIGQGFSIYKNSLHEYHSSEDDPWEYFWLIFDGDEDYVNRCFEGTGISLKDSIFDIPFFSQLLQLIEKMIYDTPSVINSSKALSYLYALISLHETAVPNARRISAADTHIQNAKLYIRNNYHRNIRITEIANHMYVDDRYLYNLFMKKLGISPKTYINRLRISRACMLLCNSALSVTNIASSVGYDDVLAFSSFFKRNMGISPSEYRRRNSIGNRQNEQFEEET